jgi:hypothetical protein
VNLPVRDLAKSLGFYVALGGTPNPQFSDDHAKSVMFSDAIGVMLMTHERYRTFTQRPIGDARRESQALIALSTDSPRPRRPKPGAGSRLHVQPQHRGPRRLRVGDHVDGHDRAGRGAERVSEAMRFA